jgi:hypothetical protein
MSFGGSVLAMITTLQNNRNLLRSNKGFLSRARIGGLKESYQKAKEELAAHQSLSEFDRQLIRNRIRRQYRRRALRNRSLFLIILISFALSVYALNARYTHQQKAEQSQKINRLEAETNAAFREALTNADESFKTGNYYRALHQYLKALKLRPEDAKLAYKYALSCTLACEVEDQYCDRVMDELKWVSSKHPQDKALQQLYLSFKNNHPELH